MPDMLVLSRNKKTGALVMEMEIDTATSSTNRKSDDAFKNIPWPNAHDNRPSFYDWATQHEEDIEWLQKHVVDYVNRHDWGPECVQVDWRGLLDRVARSSYIATIGGLPSPTTP